MSPSRWETLFDSGQSITALKEFTETEVPKALEGGGSGRYWEPAPLEVREVSLPGDADAEEHVRTLKLPHIPSKQNPDAPIFVDGLGSFSGDPVLKERVDSIFSGQHTFLLNTSGSGKTRLLYEGLCENWGLYFTSIVDTTYLGSRDLEYAIRSELPRLAGFAQVVIPENFDGDGLAKQCAHNLELAHRVFSSVLLIRLLFFKAYFEAASTHPIARNKRKTWLQSQLRFPCGAEIPYEEIRLQLKALPSGSAYSIVETAIAQTLADIFAKYDVATDGFLYVVLDEANYAVNSLDLSFWDDRKQCPLLKVIIRVWRKHLQAYPVIFVISGTKIPAHFFSDPDEWAGWVWSSNTGAFDNKERYWKYVSRYIPPGLARTAEGKRLMERMWKWLRGRHRCTASFIGILLQRRFRYPHQQLDAYISSLVGGDYWPQDSQHNNTGEDMPFSPIAFYFGDGKSEAACYMHESLLSILLHKNDRVEFPSREDTICVVSDTYGRFTDANCGTITIDEPVLLAGGAHFFNSDSSGRSIVGCEYLCNHIFVSRLLPRHSAGYSVLCVASAFDSPHERTFDEVFNLARPFKAWRSVNPVLIFSKRTSNRRCRETVLKYSTNFSQRIASWAYTASQALTWIRSRPTPFCIYTPNDSAAVLFFVLRGSNKERIWVILKVVPANAEGETEVELGERTRAAAVACLPQNIFGDSVSPSNLASSANAHRQHTLQTSDFTKALKSLPGLSPDAGESGVLRVLVSFSEKLDISHLPRDTAYPVAILNMDTISQTTKAYDTAAITKCVVTHAMNNAPTTPSSSKRKRASSPAGVAQDADPSLDAKPRTSKRAALTTSNSKIATSSRATPPLTRSQTAPRRSGRLAK
ncbi:hypothetical protein V5O48_012836 [Marasmius crinis-equi]|uniref:Crinkler (CRN) family protein n=1 Tax=Marasmius crinis-equi TaxID=585013 RepID=A0ABR3F1R8_9AGAR